MNPFNLSTVVKLLVSLVFAALILILFEIGCNRRQQQQNTSAKAVLQHPAAKVVKQFTDTSGKVHLDVLANSGQIPESALTDSSIYYHTLADSFARDNKIKASQIDEITRQKLSLSAENIQLKAESGTPGNHLFSYRDKWLQLIYDTESNKAMLDYTVSLVTGKYTPASFFLVNKPAVIDFYTDDPRAKIEGVDHLLKTIPGPALSLSGTLLSNYDVTSKQITPYAQINFRYKRWHIIEAPYYATRLKNSISLGYDLFALNF